MASTAPAFSSSSSFPCSHRRRPHRSRRQRLAHRRSLAELHRLSGSRAARNILGGVGGCVPCGTVGSGVLSVLSGCATLHAVVLVAVSGVELGGDGVDELGVCASVSMNAQSAARSSSAIRMALALILQGSSQPTTTRACSWLRRHRTGPSGKRRSTSSGGRRPDNRRWEQTPPKPRNRPPRGVVLGRHGDAGGCFRVCGSKSKNEAMRSDTLHRLGV